jgi:hypothetical protein
MKDTPKVSVVLNGFERPHTFPLQLQALNNQTVQPLEILTWINGSYKIHDFDYKLLNQTKLSINSFNYGVWARFSFALNTRGDYVCIFDDDTIPGPRWIENCLSCMEKQEGLYGAIGIIFEDLDYIKYNRHGWANPNEEIVQTDIVGHCWFFPREYLSAFWREATIPLSSVCGEDMHLSYSIQKYLGKSTFVPPHPKENKDLWGSDLLDTAYRFGVDTAAVSVNYHQIHFGKSLKHYYNKGFKFLKI